MSDLSAVLDNAALPERTVQVCLRGDLLAQVEELERELDEARSSRALDDRLAGRGELRKLDDEIAKARAAMAEASVVFRLRGLTRRAWMDLVAAHEPRSDNAGDSVMGYNTETFFPALARACIVDPAVDDEQWQRLDAVLSAGQMEALIDAALAVSRRKVDVPFSPAAFVSPPSSDET